MGQRYVEIDGHMVDEDSFLLDQIFHVQVPIESMSPVTIDATFTRRYLEGPEDYQATIVDRICRAFDRVSWEKDFTIIEGTGHAGVGKNSASPPPFRPRLVLLKPSSRSAPLGTRRTRTPRRAGSAPPVAPAR